MPSDVLRAILWSLALMNLPAAPAVAEAPQGRTTEKVAVASPRAEVGWAFEPVRRLQPPRDPGCWSANPIDRFVRAKQQEQGLEPASPAEKRTLIRRATFDLIGLARKGIRSALWRSLMTALVAVLLTLLDAIPDLRKLLLRYPELLCAQTGCIVLIAKYLNWRCLEWLNPKETRKRAKKTRRTSGTPNLFPQGLAAQPSSTGVFHMATPDNGHRMHSETSNGGE